MRTPLILIAIGLGLLLTLPILMSCEERQEVINESETQHTKIKPFSLDTQGMRMYDNGIVRGSDKHEYLITSMGAHSQNVEHYIDCELCKSRQNAGE